MRTMRMEREDIENSLKVLSHIVDDDFIITVDEARKIIRIDGETIEALLSFAHYVADKVTMSDEDWEDYHEAFTEVACRKLVKLGVISIEDDMYVYRQDEPQEVQE